jgi:hypothetical protein
VEDATVISSANQSSSFRSQDETLSPSLCRRRLSAVCTLSKDDVMLSASKQGVTLLFFHHRLPAEATLIMGSSGAYLDTQAMPLFSHSISLAF